MLRSARSPGAWRRVCLTPLLSLALPAGAQAQDATGRPTLAPAARRFVQVDAPVVALTHVRVIDGTGAPAREDQTVILQDGRIAGVGPAARMAIPSGATRLDLSGHTVTPGFVGMHEHTYFRSTSRTSQMSTSGPRIYLALGVTTIRTAGSMFPYSEINMKRAIETGETVGPRMHITGPYLNGSASADGLNRALASADEARRVVAYWGEEGATWLKFSGNISRAILGAAIEEAHKHGMKVTGHLCSVTFAEAAALGIDGLEHGFITNSAYVADKVPDVCPAANMRTQVDVDVASPVVQASIRQLVEHHVALTSTLAVYETFVKERATLPPRAMALLAPDVRAEVEADHAALGKDGFAVPERLLKKMMAWERDFVRAGGLLTAGVDPWGTIAPGKLADLVVLRGNPVARPADIYDVVTVFKDGVGYDSAKLLEETKGLVGIR
jgi:imidazolonepropionase-like amidohydrolase